MRDELVQRGELELFTRRVHIPEGGSEGNHVQVREFLQEQAAFEAGVDGLDLGVGMKEPFVGVHGDFQDAGVQIRFPTGVLAVVLHIEGPQEESGFHPFRYRVQFGNDRTALACDDLEDIPMDMRGGQVRRGFNQAGNVHGHLLYAVRDAQEGHDDAGGIPFLDRADEGGFLRDDDLEVRVAGLVFGLDEAFEGGCIGDPFFEIRRRDGDDGLRFAADGIGLVPALDGQ